MKKVRKPQTLNPKPKTPNQVFFVGLYLKIGKKGRDPKVVKKQAGKARDMSGNDMSHSGRVEAVAGGGGAEIVSRNVYWLTRRCLLSRTTQPQV